MDIVTIIKLVGIILQLIATGMSEEDAIGRVAARYDISERIINKFM